MPEYSYYVDNKRYTTTNRTVTGMYVRVRIPNFDDDYLVFLIHKDGLPDTLFRDQDTVEVISNEVHFYTCPRGTWGG